MEVLGGDSKLSPFTSDAVKSRELRDLKEGIMRHVPMGGFEAKLANSSLRFSRPHASSAQKPVNSKTTPSKNTFQPA